MEDEQIVDLFWERSETAISETEKKYGRYCHYISYQILNNDSDAEEIVNDTYLKTWNTIPPKRPDSLKSYVGMISRQLSLNRYEQEHTQKRSGQVALAIEELSECMEKLNEVREDVEARFNNEDENGDPSYQTIDDIEAELKKHFTLLDIRKTEIMW